MYIEEIHVRGYAGLSGLLLQPSHGLNVIHGPAGAGKTTVCNCLRDLLLGPGRWESAEGGPRCPHARPSGGERFQAQLRYRVGARGFTILRDFDAMSARARDDNAGQEIPMSDGRAPAPGVVRFRLDETAPSEEGDGDAARRRLEAARARKEGAEREAAGWAWCEARALLSDLDARLRRAADLQQEADAVRSQAAQHEGFAKVNREHRDAVIRASARLHALEREVGDGQRMLDALMASRRDLGGRLAAYERFYTVSEADLEKVKTLELAEAPTGDPVTEKEKNLEGFRQQEADIKRRLDEIAPRFEPADSDDDFDMRLNQLERELGRTELLTSRIVERDRLQGQIDPTRRSSRRFLMLGAAFLLVGVVLLGLYFTVHQPGLLIGGGLSIMVCGPMFMKKSIDDTRLRDLESESGRVLGDIEKLKVGIEASREQVRVMLEAAGVPTIKDLRGLHREMRSLQRDAETVRAYRKVLESDLEAARQKAGRRRVETPPLLVECGILKAGEVPTPRAVADFFEAYHAFRALQQEEDSLKRRLSELQAAMTDKVAEQESLQQAHVAALAAMGLTSEADMEAALLGRREYDRLQAELDTVVDRQRAVLRGVEVAEAEGEADTLRRQVAELEGRWPDLASLEASADRLEEYRGRRAQAQQQVHDVAAEIAALEAGEGATTPSPSPAVDGVHPLRLERHLALAWERVTGQTLQVRASDGPQGPQIEVREGDDRPWLPALALGSVSARLLAVLLEGETARLGGAGAMPAFLDNPFALLEPAWQARLVAWLLELSDAVQVFVTLSMPDVFDDLRTAMATRGTGMSDLREGRLQLCLAAAAVEAAP